jgi:hypothetical protein
MPADGVYYDVPEDAYHADRGSLSVSGAKLLLKPSCPAKFDDAMRNPPEPKKEFDFGHVAHRVVLGKGADYVVLDPAVHGLKKDGTVADSPRATATWKSAEAMAREGGLTPIHVDDFRRVEEMAAQIRLSAGSLFDDGNAEVSLYHTDPGTGVQLRGRIDWLTSDDDGRVVCVDYKTSLTSNPEELERKFWGLRYFMQDAWYRDLLISLGVSDDPRFLFVVQEKKSPYLVEVVEYDPEAVYEGRRWNREAINLYAHCRQTKSWPGYSGGRGRVTTITLPRFALNTARVEADQQAAQDLIAELEGIYSYDDN